MPTLLLTPTASDAGKRVDVFIAGATPELSRTRVKRLIQQDCVLIGGQAVGPAARVQAGDAISIELAESAAAPLEAEKLETPILHCDADIVVVDKPAGLVVHPGAGQHAGTLVNQLLSRFPELLDIGHPERPGIVHRLDKETSGVMVIARSQAAYESLVKQFAERAVDKCYLALVEGSPSVEKGVIDAPVGRHPSRRTRMSVVSDGKPATTHFVVLEHLDRHTLLRVTTDTGRTHQIRVHLSAAGLPIAGDAQYGGKSPLAGLQRMFLHAFTLGFSHPATNGAQEFRATLAVHLMEVLRRCGSAWAQDHQVDPVLERT